MQTERQRQATEIRAQGEQAARGIRADADRQATVIVADANGQASQVQGDGEAERNRIFAQAYGKDPSSSISTARCSLTRPASRPGRPRLVISPRFGVLPLFRRSARQESGDAEPAAARPAGNAAGRHVGCLAVRRHADRDATGGHVGRNPAGGRFGAQTPDATPPPADTSTTAPAASPPGCFALTCAVVFPPQLKHDCIEADQKRARPRRRR